MPAIKSAGDNKLVGYGRAAEACARQVCEEAQKQEDMINTQQAQRIIDTIFEMYPGIPLFQERIRARAHDPCWIRTYYGRYRRCIPATDKAAMGEIERQFMNFPEVLGEVKQGELRKASLYRLRDFAYAAA